MAIERGDRVVVRDAMGHDLERRALSGVEMSDFEVVWVCLPEEWDAALVEGRNPEGVPFPADDVRLADEVTVA